MHTKQIQIPVAPEFDSSRHFRKSALNEINNLEALFAFSCGGTFL
jgi:hypothetical protein